VKSAQKHGAWRIACAHRQRALCGAHRALARNALSTRAATSKAASLAPPNSTPRAALRSRCAARLFARASRRALALRASGIVMA